MTKLKLFIVLLLLLSVQIAAQFSLDKFIDEPINSTLDEMKQNLSDKKLTQDQQKSFIFLSFYDWIEPVSVKVTYMFKENGTQTGKILSNSKTDEQDSKIFFDLVYNALVKKYGESLNKNSLFGATAYSWYGKGGSVISLTHKSDKTILMIMILK